ncbi:ACP phosphodiesterase [Marinospirillum perlucidum]|uniref:acyl carrier protein phosphodiesterase n=1 Tax=Marinospirillum perlucidum TaxID=1982602 RepID=UPI000DF2EE55|nr:ACP phosphodiesterase [Marinospirillum perlucidum]
MNYLAHLHLGGPEPEQLLGSLYGDFVKGPLKGEFPPQVEAAIDLHRRLDGYTDRHPLVHQARSRFSGKLWRYSGIVLDVFFDHCLACHWTAYASTPLPQFTQQVYHLLQEQERLPGRLEKTAAYMIADDWLVSYQDFAVIRQALNGISRRLRQPGLLDHFWPELEQNYQALTEDFHQLYPQLQAFALEHPSRNQQR